MIAWCRVWPTLCRSLCADSEKSQGSVGAKGRAIMGGSAGMDPEAAETLKWIAKAWWEQLVLYTDSEATVTRT